MVGDDRFMEVWGRLNEELRSNTKQQLNSFLSRDSHPLKDLAIALCEVIANHEYIKREQDTAEPKRRTHED